MNWFTRLFGISAETAQERLWNAICQGEKNEVRKLLKRGVNVNAIYKDRGCWTPLLLASLDEHTEVVKLLLAASADVNAADEKGMTPLFRASEKGHTEVVKLLLAASADVNAADEKGRTPLFRASQEGHTEVVKLLLAASADVNAADNVFGNTPLLNASGDSNIRTEMIKLLLAANADVTATGMGSDTPLMRASATGNTEAIKLLLAANADVNATGRNGDGTPLMRASATGHREAIKLLLAANADVNATDYIGRTSLMAASRQGKAAAVKLLLAANADINATDCGGGTSLMAASLEGHTEVVKLLLAANADVNATNKKGETPLMIASRKGHSEIVELLLAANPNIKAVLPEEEKEVRVRISLFDANTNAWLKVVYLFLVEHVKANGSKPTFYEDIGPRFLGMDYDHSRDKKEALLGAMRAIAKIDIEAGRPPLSLVAVGDSGDCMPDPSVVNLATSLGVRCSGVGAYEQMEKIARFWKNCRPEFE